MKILYIIIGFLIAVPVIVGAINITVPSSKTSGYTLVSTSTGAYVATTTDPFHVGSIFGTSTVTSTFNGGVDTLLLNVNSPTATSTITNSLGIGTTTTKADLTVRGHIQTGSPIPVATSCGTDPVVRGSDHSGKVVIGTGVISSCTLTFSKAWTNAPACSGNNETAILLVRAVSTITTVVLSVATTFPSDTISYKCDSYE